MIPPVCMTCGNFLADKEVAFETELTAIMQNTKLSLVEKDNKKKEIMTKLGIKRYCCRTQTMTAVSLIDVQVSEV
jgi:DNA-directed RNA polymerase subunit N (RpoN/RPB10)